MTHFLANVWGTKMSQGTVSNMPARLSHKATPFDELIRAALGSSKKAVGADETSCSVNGANHWAWVWQDQDDTYLTVSDNRCRKTVAAHFPKGFPHASLSSDRRASHLNNRSGKRFNFETPNQMFDKMTKNGVAFMG